MFHTVMNAAIKIAVTTGKLVLGMALGLLTVVGIIFKAAIK